MHRGNEHGLAGAIYKPGSHTNRIPAVDDFKQIRELTTVRDKLYKEIEKLNSRNDLLAQDNTKLRNTNFSQQREIKILRNVNEKVATEKNQLATEYDKCKEQKSKLETHFSRLSDAIALQSHIEGLKQQIDMLNRELHTTKNQVLDRDDSIRKLNEEIDALNIALDNHVHYDRGNKAKGNDTLSRETLREMCYKMAKKEAELHNMSVSLADVYEKLETYRKSNEDLSYDRDTFKMQLEESLNRYEDIQDALDGKKVEYENVTQKYEKLCETNARLDEVIEDLSRRSAEHRQAHEDCASELAEKTAELNALKEEHKMTMTSLKKKLESAQVAMAHKDTVMAMCEQRLASDREHIKAERDSLKDKIQRVDYLEREIELIRSSSLLQIEERDQEIEQLKRDLRGSLAEVEKSRREVSQSFDKASVYDQLVKERDTLSDALQNAMATSKGIKAKLQHEIKRRETAEAEAAATEERVKSAEEKLIYAEQSKSQYSFAVLDAYEQEREKTTLLEKELNVLRASLNDADSRASGSREMSDSRREALRDSRPLPPTPPMSPVKDNDQTIYSPPQPQLATPSKRIDPNVTATHDLIGTIQRIRGDLNKAILDEVTSNTAEEVDNTVYYNPKNGDDSASSDDLVGAAIDMHVGNQ